MLSGDLSIPNDRAPARPPAVWALRGLRVKGRRPSDKVRGLTRQSVIPWTMSCVQVGRGFVLQSESLSPGGNKLPERTLEESRGSSRERISLVVV